MNEDRKKGQALASTGVATRVMRREEGESEEAFAERVKVARGEDSTLVSRTAEGEVKPPAEGEVKPLDGARNVSKGMTDAKRLRFELTTPDLERVVSETFAPHMAEIKPTNRASAIRGVREMLEAHAEIVNSAGHVVAAPEVLIANLAMRLHAPSTRIDQPRTKPRLRDQVRAAKSAK